MHMRILGKVHEEIKEMFILGQNFLKAVHAFLSTIGIFHKLFEAFTCMNLIFFVPKFYLVIFLSANFLKNPHR